MTYPRRWIGCVGPIAWPPRFPWGHLKLLFYATPVDTPEDLIAWIVVAAADIKSIPGSGGLARLPACPMASGPLKQKTIWAPQKVWQRSKEELLLSNT
ncbi:hypothetical protein AVEN_221321-1 [Araneus ventricosus]|uniref:Uncharacterized protein n=1 Tax=Araneus ventricosus TaxID=182803 RepID=A0A4Y2AZT0_ARAVE|nr:hypothetical protein AVEN_221321-1 [Araneus ventricosus]